jgi:hypothetical protein
VEAELGWGDSERWYHDVWQISHGEIAEDGVRVVDFHAHVFNRRERRLESRRGGRRDFSQFRNGAVAHGSRGFGVRHHRRDVARGVSELRA